MQYGRHIDNAFMSSGRADLSFTIFLNSKDKYEGGELVIENINTENIFTSISKLSLLQLILLLEFLITWNFHKIDIVNVALYSHSQLTLSLIKARTSSSADWERGGGDGAVEFERRPRVLLQ